MKRILRRVRRSRGSTSATAWTCGCASAAPDPRRPAARPPRTHTTWHRVRRCWWPPGYIVVCPDLRGYGQSSKPPTTAGPCPVSKRAMAGDVVGLMRRARARAVRRRRARPRQLRGAPAGAGPPRRGHPPGRARLHPDRRAPRPHRRPVRRGLVALVLLRPARQARARDQRRPGGLVRLAGAREGRGVAEPRRPPAAIPESGHRAGDARGLPGRPQRRSRRRGGRPRRRSAGALPDVGALVVPGRPRGPARGPAGDLGGLDRRSRSPADRSTAVTTWPRRRPSSWPWRWPASSRCDHLRAPG